MSDIRTVVLVGHCGPDGRMLRSAVLRNVPHAEFAVANDDKSLQANLASDSLLLINRVLDGAFAFEHGVDLIASLAQSEHPPVMMLISNFANAQQLAVKAGARPGFGKSQLYNEATAQIIREAVNGRVHS